MASFERQDSLSNKATRKTSGRSRDLLSSEHFTKVALSLDRLKHSSRATLQTAEASARALCRRTSRARFGQGTKLRHPWCHFISHHTSNLQRLIDLSRKKPSPEVWNHPIDQKFGKILPWHRPSAACPYNPRDSCHLHCKLPGRQICMNLQWIKQKTVSLGWKDNSHIPQLRALIPFFFKASALQDEVFSDLSKAAESSQPSHPAKEHEHASQSWRGCREQSQLLDPDIVIMSSHHHYTFTESNPGCINDMCKKTSICFKSPWLVVAPWLPLSSLQDNRPSGTGHRPFQSASCHPFFGRIYQRKIDLGRAVLQYLISKLRKLLFQCSHCYLGTDQESNQHRPTLPGVPKEAIPRKSPRFFSSAKLRLKKVWKLQIKEYIVKVQTERCVQKE